MNSECNMLSDSDRSTLLTIAREAITAAANHQAPPLIDLGSLAPTLSEERATFVTLSLHGDLRGCIGGLYPVMPLALDAQQHALNAALEDPRFPPVSLSELPGLHIEISVLTVPEPLAHTSPEDLLVKLRPGIDGVILKSGWWHKATFLPQVWEKVPDPVTFLEMLSEKAGASANLWREPGTEVYVYQVEVFEEHAAHA